jgi:acetylornithine/succinyldiaminopimelate/putrescine aminotransferase
LPLLDVPNPQKVGYAIPLALCRASESIEPALKLARQYQVEIGQAGRHQILSRQQSYDGSTLGAGPSSS